MYGGIAPRVGHDPKPSLAVEDSGQSDHRIHDHDGSQSGAHWHQRDPQ